MFLFLFGVQLWQYELWNAIIIHYIWDIGVIAMHYVFRYGNKPKEIIVEQPLIKPISLKSGHYVSKRRRSTGSLNEFRMFTDGYVSLPQPDWLAKMGHQLQEHEWKRMETNEEYP